MTEWAFMILLTFSAFTDDGEKYVSRPRFMCIDAHCVGKMERRARESTTLTRFQVFERGHHGLYPTSGVPAFAPIIDWSPM